MLSLMENQGHTLLETLLTSSENALTSYETIENEVRNRLLNNAVMIKIMYEKGLVTNQLLAELSKQNKIFRINIFDAHGNKLFGSNVESSDSINSADHLKYLKQIFNDEADTLIIGLKPARIGGGSRFAVAVATNKRGAIVLNVDADELLNFRNNIGFGILLKNVTGNKNIEYAALQNNDGIIAASGKTQYLEDIDSSAALQNILKENNYRWRIINYGDQKIFEGLHPFIHKGNTIGIFRLGLSMEPLENINSRITQRIIFIGLALLVFGFVTLAFVFTRQNFDVLTKRYKAIESYSNQIIENVNDGIIVLDSQSIIKTINSAALGILELQSGIDKNASEIFGGNNCNKILESASRLQQIDCVINGRTKILLVSKSILNTDEDSETVLIFSDMTEQILMEKQIHRKEKLATMGELASSVAHEIRNPLNAIGTIAQQLNKDFEPKENVEEYKSLSKLVYKEVKRINETIENFLMFAKPMPIKAERFDLREFLLQIHKQYKPLLDQKNIALNININWNGTVKWDSQQIKQVMINLIENSIHSIEEAGKIEIDVTEKDSDTVEIKLSDNGKGIPSEMINKIFNLYFTTKTNGSGIGLSVVQKIINEHNGIISVESRLNNGTVFTILIPKEI
jgi:signal transduction histidine kinase